TRGSSETACPEKDRGRQTRDEHGQITDRQHEREMESGKVQRRLSRSADRSNRRESGSRRGRNRRETEESSQADQSNRSGFRPAEELGANWRKEERDWQVAQETEATCKESGVM